MQENELLATYEAQQSWDSAHSEVLVQKVVCTFKNCSTDLIPFEEVRKRLNLTQMRCQGVMEIELAQIRGSVGRFNDFTSAFLPRRKGLRQRWQRVKMAISKKGMPPIDVYQVGNAYFVVDGNHRVSIARQAGWKTIEAYVCEFVTPVKLSGEADLDEVLIAAEYAEFLKNTQLDKLRPGLEILFTSPGRYRDLECMIKLYQDTLSKSQGQLVAYKDALLSWLDKVYAPAIQEIAQKDVMRWFPDRTEADLFIWMWKHQQRLERLYAIGPIGRVVEAVSSFVRGLNNDQREKGLM